MLAMQQSVMNLVVATMLLWLAPSRAAIDWQWRTGRATYYGSDAWSIHKGSCGYGALWSNEPLGWNVAAMTDYHPDYPNACGTCYEVQCQNMPITDNYGAKLDRTYACYAPNQSVVVRITDTCPCTYAPNEYSNKRWCCNDLDHFDVSVWAFEKLADTKWGVIGIKYRPVPCDYKPQKVAPPASNPTPLPADAPWGIDRPLRDWPEYTGQRERTYLFKDSRHPDWQDASFNPVNVLWENNENSKYAGMRKGAAVCTSIGPKGALAFRANQQGAFVGKYKLELWVYVGLTGWEGTAATVPDIKISLKGTKGQCNILKIFDVKPDAFEPTCNYCADYYWRYTFYLPFFAGQWSQQTYNNPNQFTGCGGNTVWDLNEVQIYNDWGSWKWACLDNIALV